MLSFYPVFTLALAHVNNLCLHRRKTETEILILNNALFPSILTVPWRGGMFCVVFLKDDSAQYGLKVKEAIINTVPL